VKSTTTARFRVALSRLPDQVQRRAHEAYALFGVDPSHPSLRLKKVLDPDVYSARITRSYRALGVLQGNTLVWFWIGPHAEYDELLKHL
jgi:hypothetical protein